MLKFRGPFDTRYRKTPNGCFQWLGCVGNHGYGIIIIDGKKHLAHRFAWQRKFGPIPPGLQILHACDNRRCVNPDHLSIGSIAANNADMRAKDRHARGGRHGHSKLTDDRVRVIRSAVAMGVSRRLLQDRYGISRSVICDVVSGKAWAHVR